MIKILQQIKRKAIAIIEKLIKNYHKKNPNIQRPRLNHIALLVGCAYANLEGGTVPGPNQVPDYLIIDDPYGNSKGLSGNDILIPFSKCVPINQYIQRPDVKSSNIGNVVNGYTKLCSDLMKEKSPNSSSLDKWARNKYIEYSCLPIL